MPRLFISVVLWVSLLAPALAQTKESVLDVSHRQFTDEDLAKVASPEKVEVLILRGGRGYGSNRITEAGIAQLTRFKNLRILHAGGFEFSDQALETIGRLTSLEELAVDSNRITGSGLHHLARLKKLRHLRLDFNPLDRDTLEAIRSLPDLTHLSLRAQFAVDDRILELCARLSKLEELHLPENTATVTDRGLEYLSRIKSLKNVALRGATNVTDVGLAHLSRLTDLQEVSLSDLRSVTPRGIDNLGKLVALQALQIDGVPMDGMSVQSLGSLKKLEHLLLWSVANGELSLDTLRDLQSLRTFRTNQIVTSSAIRALATLNRLESIADELTEIADEDLKHLARLPRLHTLMLDSKGVSVASLPTLSKMKSLRLLYVGDKVAITSEQLTLLGQTSLTQCQIARLRPPYTVFHKPISTD